MHTLSSKAKLEINDIRDVLIVKKSYQLARISDTNTKSAFVSLTTICHNYSGCRHLA
jgi:hypothetical protein